MRPVVDRERLERFLVELGRRAEAPARVYLVGGASAILHGFREATIDVDLVIEPADSPLLRSFPEIKEALAINLELASPLDFLPELPGWRDRSRFLRQEGKVAIFEFDLYAQALAKIERGYDRDLADVRQMLTRGLVEPTKVRELFAAIEPELFRFPAIDAKALREDVERVLADA
ncbi:MAG TPA: DUF6036 family nucleotidyltransferase [Thermoanaerobaculia bacterium]